MILLLKVVQFLSTKSFKIHKKFSEVDQNGLISEFYNALDNQGQLTDFISLATGLLQCRIQ